MLYGLKKHMLAEHTLEVTIPCKSCTRRFNSRHQLYRHMKRHTKVDQFYCNKDKHLDSIQPFKCYVCDQRFFKNVQLKKHLISHKTQKKHNAAKSNRDSISLQTQSKSGTKPHIIQAKKSIPNSSRKQKNRDDKTVVLGELKKLSPQLATIVGSCKNERLSRAEINKRLWAYLKKEKLLDESLFFIPDELMKPVFGTERVWACWMAKYLVDHLS